jgi:hypothetical protein
MSKNKTPFVDQKMNNDFFNRDMNVARIDEESLKESSEKWFQRDTEVARVNDIQEESSATIQERILENATSPKRVQGDAGSVEQHSLQDQIAAARFLQSQKASQNHGLGIKLIKTSPDGAV